MGQKTKRICPNCGGKLKKKDAKTYMCLYCNQEYYISVDKTRKIHFKLPVGKSIIVAAVYIMLVLGGLVGIYHVYTMNVLKNSDRFSQIFTSFLTEAYDKEIHFISDADLERMKYLKIEKKDGDYVFSYSFSNYYDFPKEEEFLDTVQSISADGNGYAPSNLKYFTGLTKVEIYTGAWENYELPKENELRSIHCVDGYSNYGKSQFFQNINPHTIEEVIIYQAEDLTDFSFFQQISQVKKLTLEDVVIKDVEAFLEFEKLEELTLLYPEIEEEKIYAFIEELLSIPTLKRFNIEGSSAWYLTEEEWGNLKKKYDGRVVIERK